MRPSSMKKWIAGLAIATGIGAVTAVGLIVLKIHPIKVFIGASGGALSALAFGANLISKNRKQAKISQQNLNLAKDSQVNLLEYFNKEKSEQYFFSGNSKIELSDYRGAISDYSKALEIDPELAGAYSNRAFARRELNDEQGAIADYSKAIDKNPLFADAIYARGCLKLDMGDYSCSIADFSKALQIDSHRWDFYMNRGIARHKSKDYKGAIIDFSKALEIDPLIPLIYFNRALSREKVGDLEGATKDRNAAAVLQDKNLLDSL